MPNWCITEYKCVGEPNEVRALHKILKSVELKESAGEEVFYSLHEFQVIDD